MIGKIKAIIWKEWRESFFQQSLYSKIRILLLILVVGILLPLKKGPIWFELPFFYGVGIIGPFIMLMTVVCDLFAGERERHTLETLYASKLTHAEIISGKIAFAISYATTITILLLLLNIVVVNVNYYEGTLIIFSATAALKIALINTLSASVFALLGTLASSWSSSVKQAQITLTILVVILIGFPMLIISQLPIQLREDLSKHVDLFTGDIPNILIISSILLLLCGVFLFYLFQSSTRSRLLS